MRPQLTVRWAYKDGNAPEEYEDAYRVVSPGGGALRVVVSDGATESSLAGRWARLLTASFADAPEPPARSAESFARLAAETAGRWEQELGSYLAGREADGKPLKWYERPGLARGAYATLLVMDVDLAGSWHAAAVGDACVFQVRAGKLCQAFPVTDPDKFDDAPQLLGSSDTDPEKIAPRVTVTDGTLAAGDQFFACTDALAEWFLSTDARGQRPWEVLSGLDEDSFPRWLAETRAEGGIRNDDVTMVRADFGEGA